IRDGSNVAHAVSLANDINRTCVPVAFDAQGDGIDDVARVCLMLPSIEALFGTPHTVTFGFPVSAQVGVGQISGGVYGISGWTNFPSGIATTVLTPGGPPNEWPAVIPIGGWDGKA